MPQAISSPSAKLHLTYTKNLSLLPSLALKCMQKRSSFQETILEY